MDERSQALWNRLVRGDYGFLDFGCSRGGSISYCKDHFRFGSGLGIDDDHSKVEEARAVGYDVLEASLLSLDFPEKCVRFVSMMDFLEHLPDVGAARDVLMKSYHAARDFIFIRHPNFEPSAFMAKNGLRFTWTHWHGHTNMMTVLDFIRLFEELNFDHYTIEGQKPISDSSHNLVVPMDAPIDTLCYEESLGPKPHVTFPSGVWSHFDITVRLGV